MSDLIYTTNTKSINYTIRPLNKEDAAFQEEILYQSLYVPKDKEVFPKEIIYNPLNYKYIKDWGRDGDFGVIVEVKGTNERIGAAWFRLFPVNDKGFGYVNEETPEISIAMDYNYRNQGIGTYLLLSLINYAKTLGFKSLSLSVISENTAIHLYERIGFKVIESTMPHLVMKLEIQ